VISAYIRFALADVFFPCRVGGSGTDLRSKGRTLPGPVTDVKTLPKWNYDGSSTNQAPGADSEVILYPQAIFKDPFRRGHNILGVPIPTNKRAAAAEVFAKKEVAEEVPWCMNLFLQTLDH
jgi:glutamine synthetase